MADPKEHAGDTKAEDKWDGCPPITGSMVGDINFLTTLYKQALAAIRRAPDQWVRLESYPNGWPAGHNFAVAARWLRERNITLDIAYSGVSVMWRAPMHI